MDICMLQHFTIISKAAKNIPYKYFCARTQILL